MKRNYLIYIFILIILAAFFSGCNNQEYINIPSKSETKTATHLVVAFPSEMSAEPTFTTESNNIQIEFSKGEKTNVDLGVDLPEKFFGKDAPTKISKQITCAEDDEGNVYYVNWNKSGLYMVSDDGKTSKIISEEELINEYDLQWAKYGHEYIVGVIYANSSLYVIVGAEYEDVHFNYHIINLTEKKILDCVFDRPLGYYEDKALVVNYIYQNNERKTETSFFDLSDEKLYIIPEESYDNNGNLIGIGDVEYAADKYIVFNEGIYNYENKKFVYYLEIANKQNYEQYYQFNTSKVSLGELEVLRFIDNNMIFYDTGSSSVKEYDFNSDELETLVKFNNETRYLGYDIDANKIYLAHGQNYTHRIDNLYIDIHEFTDDCINPEDLDNAVEVYFAFDIDELSYEILNVIKTKEYISNGPPCLYAMKDYKVGDFIFTYYYDIEEAMLSYIYFSSKFKLGEEVDYNVWID